MQAIASDVYIEDHFQGVTLGAILLENGLVHVDAPPSPEDVRTWRASLMTLAASSDRLLVLLDPHPDRTLGARAMECKVLGHEKTASVFRTRPTTFKAQGEETGSDWESIPGIGSIRWASPEITFDQEILIHWGGLTVRVEYHPGPAVGASWVCLPEAKILFVGDAVVKNQPPFLSNANIPEWLDTLKLLASPAYKDWKVISGRGGLVDVDQIRLQARFLKRTQTKINNIAQKKTSVDDIDNLAKSLLGEIKFAAKHQNRYLRRLKHGIYQYYIRNFQPFSKITGEE